MESRSGQTGQIGQEGQLGQQSSEFENILNDLNSVDYYEGIHTPSYAGSFTESPYLHSQFPQSPASSICSFSRSRSPSISSYDSNINDNDDYGFSNLNFEQTDHVRQPTLKIPDEIPDLQVCEATPIAKTPTQVEYELKGQPFSFPSNQSTNRPRAHSDSVPTFVHPTDTYQESPQQHSLGKSFGHRRCRSGGREGAGTPNYGLRLRPNYKVDQSQSQSQSPKLSHSFSASSLNPLDDIDLSWLQSQQEQQHSMPQQSPFSSTSNLFGNVTHTAYDYNYDNNNSNHSINNPNDPYMHSSPYSGSSSSLYNSPSNNYPNSPYVDAQPALNSLDYPTGLPNNFIDLYSPEVNVMTPPLVSIDSIHSSPATQQSQLHSEQKTSSPNILPSLVLPNDSMNDYDYDHKPATDDATPTAATSDINMIAMSAARGGSLNNMPILTSNPTTARTRYASNNRRKQPSDGKAPKVFVCEVPGCGSSFTRHFNLKGHMRSHTNERPFVCSFDGCGRAFARQHDRKRHESLHNDDKPYQCLGCDKKFARIDGLARHHKSDLGKDCSAKHTQIEDSNHLSSFSSASTSTDSANCYGVLM
ncbi:Transcriptional regulator CRZ1 [Wallemia ichthyophaga EXF-994]|uniref:Transcriptional regulator CRZ1 n=1 Tax=Wallemia ichthyophaga (strain EXF-994 / CBS 113033) TaxID=1299270 RepID=R9ADG6_WALI9|nr:Transcriptional regulator CRZ1 [Wallemia ichthyophaga EXF-994]EOR00160.1 Transcriptional regulator CRZ1 [Wallemia ichthyophaga EXF-994]